MSDLAAQRIGVFGGTFDPVHLGHIAVATAAADELDLDIVYFVPAGQPYLRRPPVASGEDRVAMVELAVAGDERFRVTLTDIERPGPTYSIDTVREIHREVGAGSRLFLIVGADAARQIAQWHMPDELRAAVEFVVVGRPGEPHPGEFPAGHPARGAAYICSVEVGISGTDVRSAVAAGRSIAGMVPKGVEEYIRSRRLYTNPEGLERTEE